jgi:leucine dehydrogenase
LPADRGGCGDPGPFTALGVFLAMEAALARHDRAIEGAVVAIQGVGSVGGALAQRLVQAGARVLAADPDDANRAALPESVHVVEPARILDQVCDVLAPCGPARVIDAARAARVRCRIVCGAANNLLGDDAAAGVLQDRGVLLVPDFLANAGGLIHLAVALEGGDDAATLERLRVIPENLARLLATIDREGGEPSEIAGRLALDAG